MNDMSTVAEKLQTIINSKAAIKQAIIEKGGEVGDFTTYASAIANLPSGGGDVNPTATKNAVTFYDYDGAILYSYTAEEFLALTEMPPLPTQKGLICQEWNWSFEDAREYVAEYGILDVGATYITDDGKTRLYIRIAAEGRMEVPLYFQQTIANGVTIDWGDGSATETLDGTGNVNTTHRYASVGDYMISLDVAEGCTLTLANGSNMGVIGGDKGIYRRFLYKAEIGKGVTSLNYSFTNMTFLEYVTIPSTISTAGLGAFMDCKRLISVVLPRSISGVMNNYFNNSGVRIIIFNSTISLLNTAMRNCQFLSSIILPHRLGKIIGYQFYTCETLTSVIIPKSVTLVDALSFAYCSGMAFYDFSHHTAVPTLENINAFTGIPSDCKIIVPDTLYDKWVAATNWSTYASYIIKKTDWNNR